MGVRTPEAIARRAAKRGRTVEEQKASDRKKDRAREKAKKAKYAEASSAPAPAPAASPGVAGGGEGGAGGGESTSAPAPAAAAPLAAAVAVGVNVWTLNEKPHGKLKKDEKAGWLCSGAKGVSCGYLNFPHRQTCKQCHARRIATGVVEASGSGGDGARKRPEPARVKATAAAPGKAVVYAQTQRRDKAPSDPSRAWEGSNAEGVAEANAELRARHAADPASLTDDERQRVEMLLSRDARKKAKREALRDAKAAARERRAAPGGWVSSSVRGPAPSRR